MHPEILTAPQINCLCQISQYNLLGENFYMAGGASLNLRLGLRQTLDFDFFSPGRFSNENLISGISNACGVIPEIVTNREGTLNLYSGDVKLSFFHYPYPLLEECDLFDGVRLAGMKDIALMKAVAIGNRGSMKDFFDLYSIINETGLTAGDIVDGLNEKFGENRNYYYIFMAFNYFDDAEKVPLNIVKKEDWNHIKDFFELLQQDLLNEYAVFRGVKGIDLT